MNKFFRKLHLWVSIPFGIVITITCFTGAMLVFETEITELFNSSITTVDVREQPFPLEQIVEKATLSLDEGVEITGVTVSSNPSTAYKVNLSKPRRAALYVDQYTGEVKGKYERLPFFNTMRRLHRWLMDTRPEDGGIYWGKMIVGASTLAFVAILVTGIVIWWPRNRKMLRNRVRIVASKGWNRFWYDLHVAGGFYAVLLLLAMALTGLTWSFEWYRNGFYSIFGAEVTQNAGKAAATGRGTKESVTRKHDVEPVVFVDSIKTQTFGEAVALSDAVSSATLQADASTAATTLAAENELPTRSWQRALDNVAERNPQFETITVSEGQATVTQKGSGNKRAGDKYSFNESTGEITSVEHYAEVSPRSKVSAWVRTIHVGSWGGTFSKILYFLAAILGATLPLTGYYLWIKRLYGKKKRKK